MTPHSDAEQSSSREPRTELRESGAAPTLGEAFERIERELLTLQRLALVGRSAAMMAHELNNILTPILARSDDAADHGDAERMRVALRKTAVQARRAIEVTRHFMTVGDPSPGEARPCAVLDAVKEAIETFVRPLEKEGIALTLAIDGQLRVKAAPVLLHQFLFNLLHNARSALGGRKGSIRVSAVADGEHVLLEISDTGVGMPRETVKRFVNPFFRADETERPDQYPPVGLGFAVCRQIVRAHGGRIEVAERDGPGFAVRVQWPAA